MPKIETTESFEKKLAKISKSSKELFKQTKKTIALLAEDPKHPSLRSKPIQGAPGIFEATVNMQYRLTCERLDGDIIRLRVIDKHDKALKNP